MSLQPALPAGDLSEVVRMAEDDLRLLEGARLFITGGTGFVGTWLVESLLAGDRELGLGLGVTLLTRSADSYRQRCPHVAADQRVTLLEGDICTFAAPGHHDLVVHAATTTVQARTPVERVALYRSVIDGMERVIEVASDWNRPRLLFTSSGAVYGRQPPDLEHVPEEYLGGPDPLDTAMSYHGAKRAAELRVALATAAGDVQAVIGRLFAFVGPLLPLDQHFAIGNFIRDALDGGPVHVGGDGTPHRSYQYAADLVTWLLGLLVRGAPGEAYNVGSDDALDIVSLADLVSSEVGTGDVEVAGTAVTGVPPSRYVPDCSKARRELGLHNSVDLVDAVHRTAGWHRRLRG